MIELPGQSAPKMMLNRKPQVDDNEMLLT